MKIIKITPNKNGSRPALQDWNHKDLPIGYAWCPDEFVSVFYSTSPAGFVNLSVKDGFVVDMSINETALNEYRILVGYDKIESQVTVGNVS